MSGDHKAAVRLNLGSGNQPYSGYIGVDTHGWACDVVHDLRNPLPYGEGEVDEIFASHLIEHFPLWQVPEVLRDWYRVLKPKTGLLWGIVPDGVVYAKLWLQAVKKKDWTLKREYLAVFHGGFTNNAHTGEGQVHYALYDEGLLMEVLSTAGFYPVHIVHQQAGPRDFRLVFACGKGVYATADIRGTQAYPMVEWHTPPWEEEQAVKE